MNYFLKLLCMGLALPLVACAESSPKSDQQPLVQEQYRLQEDRKAFDEIRKEVPMDKKAENDELALLLNLTGNLDRSPTQIREKFSSLVSKKREKFQKDMTKKRENYVKEEKRQRDEFTKSNEAAKKEFSKVKSNPDQRREFYNDLDQKRRDFYQTLRENRDEFEAVIRDQRKNFDDYIREKNSEFTQEMRTYQMRYDENKKQKELDKKTKTGGQSPNAGSNAKDIEHEFQKVDQKPAQPIGTDQ